MECFSPADESKSGSRFQHFSSNHHTTSSTQARDSSSKVKNMLYPSGFIIFREPESLHQHSQARVCCEMRHVMTCTFVWVQQVQPTALHVHMEYRPEFCVTHAPSHFTEQTIPLRQARSLLYSSMCIPIRYLPSSTGLRPA